MPAMSDRETPEGRMTMVESLDHIPTKVLDGLAQKVRTPLIFGTAVGLALSSGSHRWGKTIRAKLLTDEEALALADLLRAAVEQARINRAQRDAAEQASAASGSDGRGVEE